MTKSHLYLTNYERQKRPDDFVKHIPWTVLTRAVRGGVIDHVGCYFLQYLMTHHKNYTPTKEQSQEFMNMSKSSFRRLLQSLKEADLISIEKQVGRDDKIHLNPDFVQVIENALNLLQDHENKTNSPPVMVPDKEDSYVPVDEETNIPVEEAQVLPPPSEETLLSETANQESPKQTEEILEVKKEKLTVAQLIQGVDGGFIGMAEILKENPLYIDLGNGRKRYFRFIGIPITENTRIKSIPPEDLLKLPKEQRNRKIYNNLVKLLERMKTEDCTGYDPLCGKIKLIADWGQTTCE